MIGKAALAPFSQNGVPKNRIAELTDPQTDRAQILVILVCIQLDAHQNVVATKTAAAVGNKKTGFLTGLLEAVKSFFSGRN